MVKSIVPCKSYTSNAKKEDVKILDVVLFSPYARTTNKQQVIQTNSIGYWKFPVLESLCTQRCVRCEHECAFVFVQTLTDPLHRIAWKFKFQELPLYTIQFFSTLHKYPSFFSTFCALSLFIYSNGCY